MSYRVALPLREDGTGREWVDIVDPVGSPANRELAERGLADFEVAPTAVLLALFERCPDGFSFVDLDAGTGIASMLCAHLFPPGRIVAAEPDPRANTLLRRVASASGLEHRLRVESDVRLDREIGPTSVVRLGSVASAIGRIEQIVRTAPSERPPVVIVGTEADRGRRDRLATVAGDVGYRMFPLKRYPTWRPLTPEPDPIAGLDGYLLFPGPLPTGFRDRHEVWAGALGACTPDRNDAIAPLAALRSALRSTPRLPAIVQAVGHDLRRDARMAWRRLDPWLPPPESRLGRPIELVLRRARRLLDPAAAARPD